MLLKKINTYVSILLLMIPVPLFAQNFTEDMKKISAKMDTASSVSIEVQVSVKDESGGAIYSVKAAMYTNDHSSLTILGEQEYLTTPNYNVSVDREENSVLILDRKKHILAMPDLKGINTKDLMKLLEANESTPSKPSYTFVSESNGVRNYLITGISGYKSVNIALDVNRMTIKSIQFKTTADSQTITLNYTTFSYNADVSSKVSSSRYFTEKNGNYTLNQSVKGFKLFTEL